MKHAFIFCGLVVFFATSAQAEPLISAEQCRALTVEVESHHADYVPGVDVRGNPVVEADVMAQPNIKPEKLEIYVSVDMAKYIGIPAPDTMTGNTKIGVITVEKGEIRFNGELLEDQPLKALGNLCMETEKASK
ncbi:MAG: hypothetical protein OXT65_11690 [Alphaproteobacteria bacterium]|nr:hypothetical protein [Alphaproteobacteria bacterium]